MSNVYLYRLHKVGREFDACREALGYALRNFDLPHVASQIETATKNDVRRALQGLNSTYVVRLFAEFEGILKDHLRTNHSGVAFDERTVQVDWLLNRALQRDALALATTLRARYEIVHRYRNSVAHRISAPAPTVDVAEARECLSSIVNRFPDPIST